jgi:acetylornithine deacetylase
MSAVTDRLELQVLGEIAERRDRIVELAMRLIAFDTNARRRSEPPRDEAALQAYLADRLQRAGADTELWEPDASAIGGERQVPPGLRFEGRPQLLARFPGSGDGRSLLLNGHIDVVSPEPVGLWSTDPWRAELRDGMLYGRGAGDMKGGVACMVTAAETLSELGVSLAGDLILNTNTDEESSGAGSLAGVAHGVHADAGICPEGTGGALWLACRGSLSVTITVAGRAGHVEVRQPHWRDGGPVNAIDKAEVVLRAITELNREWSARDDQRHAYLAPGSVITTVINGGEWFVSFPATCRLTVNVSYLPGNADANGYGELVAAEIETAIRRETDADEWMREHPPEFDWGPDLPPFEIDARHPIVNTVSDAAAVTGAKPRLGFTDSWFDAASFSRAGAAAVIGYGPRSHGAHGVDEHVAVDDLVACAQTLALSAIRWSGVDQANLRTDQLKRSQR